MNAIVCMTTDGSIGRDNNLIYKISDDLKRFRKFTCGSVVVMGRNTFESLPNGPLPDRINVVFTSRIDSGIYRWSEGTLTRDDNGTVFVVNSLPELKTLLRTYSNVWCIGGGRLYALLLPFISRIEITEVQKPGRSDDVKFPVLDSNVWDIFPISESLTDPKSGVKYIYKTAKRKAWG